MPVILKSDPSEIADGVFISSPVMVYRGCTPHRGEEVFVWTSQTVKGMGLAMRGTFLDWSRQRLAKVIVRVSIVSQLSEPRLTLEELKLYKPETNSTATGTLRTLYEKLCHYSHNKLASLDRAEAEFLNNLFDVRAHIAAPVFPEGDRFFRRHLARERNSKAIQVKKANAVRPLTCEICCFRFDERYENAADFIECHHLLPLACGGARVTRQDDLILVCANCHRVIHRHIRCYPDDERNVSAVGLGQAILR